MAAFGSSKDIEDDLINAIRSRNISVVKNLAAGASKDVLEIAA